MSKLINKYQGIDIYLVSQFEKFGVIKGRYVVEVPSWYVRNLPFFNSIPYSPNEVDWIGLYQKNNNVMIYIFGDFDFMQWWESNAIYLCNTCPFE